MTDRFAVLSEPGVPTTETLEHSERGPGSRFLRLRAGQGYLGRHKRGPISHRGALLWRSAPRFLLWCPSWLSRSFLREVRTNEDSCIRPLAKRNRSLRRGPLLVPTRLPAPICGGIADRGHSSATALDPSLDAGKAAAQRATASRSRCASRESYWLSARPRSCLRRHRCPRRGPRHVRVRS